MQKNQTLIQVAEAKEIASAQQAEEQRKREAVAIKENSGQVITAFADDPAHMEEIEKLAKIIHDKDIKIRGKIDLRRIK